MRSISSLAAAATVAYAVSVKAGGSPFRGRDIDGKWRAPRETQTAAAAPGGLAYMAQIGLHASPALKDAPATTAPATLADRFWERTNLDNTCAYLYGNATDSLYCNTNSACVVNTDISMVGCCDDTSSACTIYTTCYPASSRSKYTTDNSLTLFCNDGTYSECVTHYYVDSIYTGYTLLGCGLTAAVDNVYYQPTSDSSSSSSSSLKKTTSMTTSSPTSTTHATAPTTTAARHKTHAAKSKKSSSSGAIAGGVVGGIAALTLIATGILYLLRRNKNKADGAAPPAAGAPDAPDAPDASGTPGVPPGQPPMVQNGYYSVVPSGDVVDAGAGAYHQVQQPPPQQQPYDPARASMYAATASPLGSPPTTQSPQGTAFDTPETAAVSAQHTGSPQPPVAPYTAPAPAPGMGFHSGPVPANLAELPTERGHDNVQELA